MNPHRSRDGRFRRPTVREAAPLLALCIEAKSAPHVAGWRVRKERWRWKRAIKAAALRAECGL